MYVNSKWVDAEEDLDCKLPDDYDVLGDDVGRVYRAKGMVAY